MTAIVLARPHLSPMLPKINPPVAQPRMKIDVAQVPNLTWVSESVWGMRSCMVIERELVKICWSKQSNIQPKAASRNTNQ